MDMKQIFSHNLRSLCEEQGSISYVCKDLQINRQQFARYLNGSVIPNKANMERIAEYFGVVETDLFTSAPDEGSQRGKRHFSQIDRSFMNTMRDEKTARIEPGRYFVDFAWHSHPEFVIRSLLLVAHIDGMAVFRRLTARAEKSGSWWRQFNGDHHGIVLERRGYFYFCAINHRGGQEPSLLVLRHAPYENFVLMGSASVIGTEGPTIMAGVLSPVPRTVSLRSAIRQCHAHGISEPTIPTFVLDLLEAEVGQFNKMSNAPILTETMKLS